MNAKDTKCRCHGCFTGFEFADGVLFALYVCQIALWLLQPGIAKSRTMNEVSRFEQSKQSRLDGYRLLLGFFSIAVVH